MIAYALSVTLYTIIFAVVYYLLRSSFSGVSTFVDALYYSAGLTSTMGHGNVRPMDSKAKAITMIQTFMVFASVGTFVFAPNIHPLLFGAVNAAAIAGIAAGHKEINRGSGAPIGSGSYFDYLYFTTMTHTTVGHQSMIPSGNISKYVGIVHLLLVFSLMYSFSNTGVFNAIAWPLSKQDRFFTLKLSDY